jgi:hypothetical protein
MAHQRHPMALAKLRYARHKAQSKYRNIQFLFTFPDWYDWWYHHGVDKNVEVKWTGNYRPCMCRYNDLGPYEQGNVYFANHIDNVKDANHTYKMGIRTKRRRSQSEIFRYGDSLVTANWMKENHGFTYLECLQYFKTPRYDEFREIEFKKLRVSWLKKHGTRFARREWQTPTGWCRQKKLAAKAWGISDPTYSKGIHLGRYQTHIAGPCLKEYIIDNTRYPDPWWPNDIDTNENYR